MKFNVVMIDDDSVVLFLHKILIEKSNFSGTSRCFNNGREALDYLLANSISTTPYLVLLDINMPVMNGWDFLDEIQQSEIASNIYVAMLTSSINSYDVKLSQKYPQVIDYLEKPLTRESCEQLHNKVRELLLSKKLK